MNEAKFEKGDCVEFKINRATYDGTVVFIDVPALRTDFKPYLVHHGHDIPRDSSTFSGERLIRSQWGRQCPELVATERYTWFRTSDLTLTKGNKHQKILTTFLEGIEL